MKIQLPRLFIIHTTLLITLCMPNSLWAHTAGGEVHSWYALEHIVIALGICAITFLLYKLLLFFVSAEKNRQSKKHWQARKKSAYK